MAYIEQPDVPDGGPENVSVERPSGPLSQISRAMVAIYKEQFGRGPRLVHSHFAGPNAITCFLEGTLTAAEQTLNAMGEQQRLRETRMLFQYAAEVEFRSAVEESTGREVIAFLSAIDVRADVASEIFMLAPMNQTERRSDSGETKGEAAPASRSRARAPNDATG
jgi:uncharacterized protein YbcI